MVAAMSGLARLELPITNYGTELAWIAVVLLVIRVGLEDIAVEHYPMRLRTLHVEINKPTQSQKVRSLVFKVAVFFIMAAPVVGSTLNLVLGTLLFAIPQITSLSLEDNLPKKKIYLPKGVFKTIVMIFVMALAANLIEGAFSSPEAFLKWSFVVMALPGFILHYLDAISDEPETDWKTTDNGRKLYRAGGVVIYILMALVVMGVDIASWLVG
jgi:small-conductance mechanosensitive channel